ncbi:hypothetical protein CMV_025373 [Castanea mollissima]|uniref:Uncharacterized protein n=1 Tax=Castanea mollissima TaxID=60419 RepID=A0A8J4V8P4_9ROSI|nr:hypothetical protein CMV_025373 [Castanea mollissima]
MLCAVSLGLRSQLIIGNSHELSCLELETENSCRAKANIVGIGVASGTMLILGSVAPGTSKSSASRWT